MPQKTAAHCFACTIVPHNEREGPVKLYYVYIVRTEAPDALDEHLHRHRNSCDGAADCTGQPADSCQTWDRNEAKHSNFSEGHVTPTEHAWALSPCQDPYLVNCGHSDAPWPNVLLAAALDLCAKDQVAFVMRAASAVDKAALSIARWGGINCRFIVTEPA